MNTDAYIFKYLKDSVDLSKQQETFLHKKEVQFMESLGVALCTQLRHYIIYEKYGRNESPAKSYLVRRYLFIHVEDSVSFVRDWHNKFFSDWRKLEHLKSEPRKQVYTNNSGPFITHTWGILVELN